MSMNKIISSLRKAISDISAGDRALVDPRTGAKHTVKGSPVAR
jgi:hypothetical protein